MAGHNQLAAHVAPCKFAAVAELVRPLQHLIRNRAHSRSDAPEDRTGSAYPSMTVRGRRPGALDLTGQ